MSSRNRWINRFAKRSAVALAAASASAGMVKSVYADTGTWTFNGNNTWSAVNAWLAGVVADGVSNGASFGLLTDFNATNIVTLDSNRTIGSLLFNDPDSINTPAGWVINNSGGSVLTMSFPIVNGAPAWGPFIQVNGLGTGIGTLAASAFQSVAYVSAPMAGTEGLEKRGVGTLILAGNNSGETGTFTVNQGAVLFTHANAMGSGGTLVIRNGQVALRNDTGTAFNISNLEVQADTVIGVGNNFTSGGNFGGGSLQTHTIGNVTVSTPGTHSLTISGSNGYGLTMGKLSMNQGLNLTNAGAVGSFRNLDQNNANGQGSGLLTVGTIDLTDSVARTLTIGGSGTMAGSVTVGNMTQSGGGAMSLVYTGDHTLTAGSLNIAGNVSVTGNGTLAVTNGTLPSNTNLVVNGGSVLLNGSSLTHTLASLNMGGGTIATGAVIANLTAQGGSSTISLGSNVNVNSSVLTDGSSTSTAATINAKVNMGGAARTFAVNGNNTSLTVTGAITNGAGLTKTGSGTLLTQGANAFGGSSILVSDGTLGGKVQASGNAFDTTAGTAAAITTGGNIRLDAAGSAGAGTIGALTLTDTGSSTGLTVSDGSGVTTTLHVASFAGRTGNATGLITAANGHLNTTEIVTFDGTAPATGGAGQLSTYFAVQNGGASSALSFGSLSGSNVVAFGNYSGGLESGAATDVVHVTANAALANTTDSKTAVVVDPNVTITGSATTLDLGNGGAFGGGLILNGNASLNNGTLTAGSNELKIWSGGSLGNTIGATTVLGGDLTTGGAQKLGFTSALKIGALGINRNITVAGGDVTAGAGITGGGTLTKNGGGALIVGATSAVSGAIVNGGTLQLGNNSTSGDLASAPISLASGSTLAIRRTDTAGSPASIASAISGGGGVVIDGGAGSGAKFTGALSYTGNTVVNSGTLKGNAANGWSSASGLVVNQNGIADLAGFGQTVAGLTGSGTVTNTSSGATLTVNGGGVFVGALCNSSTGSLSLIKTGGGTLVLGGTNGSFSGAISINGGSLRIDDGAALGAAQPNPTTPAINLNNATLILNNSATRQIGGNNAIATTFNVANTGVSTISVTNAVAPSGTAIDDGIGAAVNASLTGLGTLALDLQGHQLTFGTANGGGTGNPFTSFSGTLLFPDSNPIGSAITQTQSAGVGNTGFPGGSLLFGNGNLLIYSRNGTANFQMGYVSGGTNTILSGNQNGGGRNTQYSFGSLPGDQTFNGRIENMTSRGNDGRVGMLKVGSSSSLTLTNTLAYTMATNVNYGTLILGPGANITQSPTSSIGVLTNGAFGLNAATLQFNGGTFTTPGGVVITMNSNVTNAGTQTLSANILVPNGFTPPPTATFLGGGSIYGNLAASTGTFNAGANGGAGTMTFANNLSVAGTNLTFDLTSGHVNAVGISAAGTNDLMKVLGTNGLTLTSGIVRLNFLGQTSNLHVGDYYPAMTFAGTLGGDPANLTTTALFHGQFHMGVGTTPGLENTIGAYVDNPTGSAVNLVWKPASTADNSWGIVGAQNFRQIGGPPTQLFFFNQDSVTFDDTAGTATNVAVQPSTFLPANMIVSTNNTYSFQGTGAISGATSVTKNGTGTLILGTTNNFTGGLTVNGGTLIQQRSGGGPFQAFGVGTVAMNGTSTITWDASAPNQNQGPPAGPTIWVNSGNVTMVKPNNAGVQSFNPQLMGSGTMTVRKVGTSTELISFESNMTSFLGTVKIYDGSAGGQWRVVDTGGVYGGNSATFDLGNGSINLFSRNNGATIIMGALFGGSNTTIGGSTATYSIGGKPVDSLYQGAIIDNGATTHLSKVGSFSTLTLTQAQTYTGNTLINAGTLVINTTPASPTFALASPTIILSSGATLDISGVADGTEMQVNGNSRFISNGDVINNVSAPTIHALPQSIIGGNNNPYVVMEPGSTLAPGSRGVGTVGTMTVRGLDTQTFGSGVAFNIEGDGTGADKVVVTDPNALLSGSLQPIALTNLGGWAPGNSYAILAYNGDEIPGISGVFVLPDFAYSVSLSEQYDGGTQTGTVTLSLNSSNGVWNNPNGGLWSTASNWTGSVVPNEAVFGTVITNNARVTLGPSGQTANSITFDSPKSYTITGNSTLTLDAANVVPVTILQGDHTIASATKFLRTSLVTVPTGSTLSWLGTITNVNTGTITNTFTKAGTGALVANQFSQVGGVNQGMSLYVTSGSVKMTVKPVNNQADGTSVLRGLSIESGATVDLTNNSMVIDLTANASAPDFNQIRQALRDGRLDSSTKAAITQRVGYRTNENIASPTLLGMGNVATFSGVAVDTSSILIRVTYGGDTNLDGQVDLNDIYNLSQSWLSTSGTWQGGDFNYDGTVNASDLTILAKNWQAGVDSPLPGMDLGDVLGLFGLPPTVVPEPTSLALAGVGALGLLSRRRRRS